MVGTGKAAEHGILFKGGEHIERTHEIDTVVLDKTGTITNGQPVVTAFNGNNETLQLLASAENGSEHPLADAIVKHAVNNDIKLLEPEHFTSIPGRGISAIIHNRHILAGNQQLMTEYNIDTTEQIEQLQRYETAGHTAMFVAVDNQINGIIAVADTVKSNAREAIQALHDLGINVVMLTGDNERTAHAIAKQVNIDTVIAEVLPEEKAAKLQKFNKQISIK